MSNYNTEGRGSLFKNDRKTEDKHPDFNGSITLGGKQYWLSAWKKTGNGKSFISVQVGKEKQARPALDTAKDELGW